jgi:hypothetical protein
MQKSIPGKTAALPVLWSLPDAAPAPRRWLELEREWRSADLLRPVLIGEPNADAEHGGQSNCAAYQKRLLFLGRRGRAAGSAADH